MSGYLLDTNIVSEIAKPEPHKGVVDFLGALEQGYISVLTLHELHYGISFLPEGRRRERLFDTIERFVATFEEAILNITGPVSLKAADLRASGHKRGIVIHLADALIAATAIEHDLTLVTRNVADFNGFDVELLNPWVA